MPRTTRHSPDWPSVVVAGALTTGALVAVAPTTATAVPGAASNVFVNEIHYDNAGTDAGEAIEIAAPAGTYLGGWSLVLYNGNGGAAYGTLPLSGNVPDAGGGWGFVTTSAAGLQNGAPDGVALVDGSGVVQFLSYEGSFTASDGPAAGRQSTDIGVTEAGTEPVGQSLQFAGAGTTAGEFTWTAAGTATFGAVNTGQTLGDAPPPPPPPPPALRTLSDIQGTGAQSPRLGERVTVEAVVTAVKPGLSGFYLQEEAADRDADPLTSEGVFVFGSANVGLVTAGQQVRVVGTVSEFTGPNSAQTQITATTSVEVVGSGEPVAATPVSFPVAQRSDLERYEGMLVELVDEMVISEYFNYDRFGEVVLATPQTGRTRLDTPTAVVEPGPPAQALAAENARRIITVDDSSSRQNPTTIPHPGNGQPFGPGNTFRGGDTVTGLVGVLDHTFGLYRVQPTTYGTYAAANPRPTSAPEVGGRLQVASFNVLNYFLTLDTGAPVCGPQRNVDCRGANTPAEFDRQRTKILQALSELDADVVGLMEMENTPGVEPAADLVAGLNELLGAGTYAYVDTGVIGTDAIRLGFLYKPGAVRPAGAYDILDSTDDPRYVDTLNRPMLTQTFDEVATGARFTVSVNHLKSKGSACPGDPDTGDGQGNCNGTRTAAAQAIVDHLATDPTGSGDPDRLIIGDLNSYDHEDPIDALVAGGYADQVLRFGGEHAYGYVFDGQVGYLDHALAGPSLDGQVTGSEEWHIDADEPDALDYNLDFGRPATFYTPDPFRSSDHDPVLVGLDLVAATPQACYPAQSVQSYEPGRRANGSPVPPAFSDPTDALGPADSRLLRPRWTSLGLGGQIVLEFGRPVQNTNGTAPDLRVVDGQDLLRGLGDRARVEASADGETWVDLGTIRHTDRLDLAGLSAASFVRVVDATTQQRPRSVDGYDLDAVEPLTGCAG